MTNRFCELCGWETPSLGVFTRFKKKTVQIGHICQCCGKIHPRHFPTLFLLKDDALKVKSGEKQLQDFHPNVSRKSDTLSMEV